MVIVAAEVCEVSIVEVAAVAVVCVVSVFGVDRVCVDSVDSFVGVGSLIEGGIVVFRGGSVHFSSNFHFLFRAAHFPKS